MSGLEIARSDPQGIPVLRMAGRLTFGESTAVLRRSVLDIASHEARAHVLLDLGAVTFIDSSGLGVLAAIHHAMRSKGGEVGLFRVPRHIREVLEMCRLNTVLRMFGSEEEALSQVRVMMETTGQA